MIHPRIDKLLDNVDSRYALVIVAAKRARQINNYHHQLGEGTFDELPPLVESRSKNYLTMALEDEFDYVIVNDDLHRAVDELEAIVNNELRAAGSMSRP